MGIFGELDLDETDENLASMISSPISGWVYLGSKRAESTVASKVGTSTIQHRAVAGGLIGVLVLDAGISLIGLAVGFRLRDSAESAVVFRRPAAPVFRRATGAGRLHTRRASEDGLENDVGLEQEANNLSVTEIQN